MQCYNHHTSNCDWSLRHVHSWRVAHLGLKTLTKSGELTDFWFDYYTISIKPAGVLPSSSIWYFCYSTVTPPSIFHLQCCVIVPPFDYCVLLLLLSAAFIRYDKIRWDRVSFISPRFGISWCFSVLFFSLVQIDWQLVSVSFSRGVGVLHGFVVVLRMPWTLTLRFCDSVTILRFCDSAVFS